MIRIKLKTNNRVLKVTEMASLSFRSLKDLVTSRISMRQFFVVHKVVIKNIGRLIWSKL